MATDFPTGLDTLTNPTATDKTNAPSHASQHANANDAIEALQAKVGADSSAVNSSHDYKLGEVTSTDKAVGKTATQTLTNKTLTSPVLDGTITGTGVIPVTQGGTGQTSATESFDALAPTTTTGDIIYYNGSDNVRLGVGSTGQTLGVSAGVPAWTTATTDPADIVDSISMLQIENNIENSISIFQDSAAKIAATSGSTELGVDIEGQSLQRYNMTNHWADADAITGASLVGDYIYVMLRDTGPDPDDYRVYRLDKTDITTASLMTFSGQSLTSNNSTLRFTSDGTDFYFTRDSGNSSNAYAIAKFTLSGTTFTYDSTITCGSTSTDFDAIAVTSAGDLYSHNFTDRVYRKYNSSGTLQDTSDAYKSLGTGNMQGLLNWNDNFFVCHEDTTNFHAKYIKIYHA